MDTVCKIDYEESPEDSAWGIIGQGLGSYNKKHAGEEKFQRLCFVLRAPNQEIVGGVLGEFYWDWFHLDLLWVKDEYRGQGYGKSLLETIEDAAKQRGALNIFLDTFSFQAPGFYEKRGYQVFSELQDFPVGHQRYFYTKKL